MNEDENPLTAGQFGSRHRETDVPVLSHSGKAVHRVYSTQGQEAFLEGHIAAFEEIGGVPTRHIRYDNLIPAPRCTGWFRRWSSERINWFGGEDEPWVHHADAPVTSSR